MRYASGFCGSSAHCNVLLQAAVFAALGFGGYGVEIGLGIAYGYINILTATPSVTTIVLLALICGACAGAVRRLPSCRAGCHSVLVSILFPACVCLLFSSLLHAAVAHGRGLCCRTRRCTPHGTGRRRRGPPAVVPGRRRLLNRRRFDVRLSTRNGMKR